MDEQFLITKSFINKSKMAIPHKNTLPMKFTLRKSDNQDSNREQKLINSSFNKSPCFKLSPIQKSSICIKNKLPAVKNNLTISLNSELSRISVVYGKEVAFKKFTENPVSNHYYEQKNYNAYEVSRINELREVNFRPKLKPLVMVKEPTLRKLSQSIFNIKN